MACTEKNLLLLVLLSMLLFSVAPAKCTSLEKTEFAPLEQVNIRINNVSGWFRPINVTALMNGYPVATIVYDAGSDLYASFIMPNGKPENLTLRVIARDYNQTHVTDSTATIERVESSETADIKMLTENVTAARTRMEEIAASIASLNVSLNAVITRLETVTELERETHGLLAIINSSMIAEIGSVAFELSQELEALREELVTLKMDTMDVKLLAVGINDATHSGNIAIADIQSQVAWLQKTVYAVAVLSGLSLIITAVLIGLTRKKHSMPSAPLTNSSFEALPLKQPLQKPQAAPWRTSGTQIDAEPSLHPETVTPKKKQKKLIRRIT